MSIENESGYEPGESKSEISKEAVIDAYRKFVERGITHPDRLNLDDPEVIEANNLHYQW